jgi:hypothetical protein
VRPNARRRLRWILRFVLLPAADRRLLAHAFVDLIMVDVALRVRGFQRLVEGAHRTAPTAKHAVEPRDMGRACRYAARLQTASRHHFIRGQCLHRSLVLHRWLRREGLPSELRIGVRKEGSALKAHAWVELGGQAVNDPPAAIAAFTPLRQFQSDKIALINTDGGRVEQAPIARVGQFEWQ